jgi:arylsulfatase A-like enzyme
LDLTTQDGQYDADDQWPALDAAGQALLEAHLWARYHGELRYLDDQVAAFWPQLESAGLLDDTLVVVWTDHGEQFWEHGHQSHAYYLAAEENDGVQFYWARDLQPRQWTGPAHAVDLVPTVLDAVGLPADPDDPTLDGEVLGLAPADRARFSLSWARQGLEQAVTVDGWKLMFDWGGEMALYDRTTDRYELVDRIADPDQRTRVQDLWAALAPRIVLAHAIEPDQVPAWPEGLPH